MAGKKKDIERWERGARLHAKTHVIGPDDGGPPVSVRLRALLDNQLFRFIPREQLRAVLQPLVEDVTYIEELGTHTATEWAIMVARFADAFLPRGRGRLPAFNASATAKRKSPGRRTELSDAGLELLLDCIAMHREKRRKAGFTGRITDREALRPMANHFAIADLKKPPYKGMAFDRRVRHNLRKLENQLGRARKRFPQKYRSIAAM